MEQDSIDEAAIDVSTLSYPEAEKFGKEIKSRIKEEYGLPCTIGISFGQNFAKMACDAAKPDGFMVLKEDAIRDFLEGKPIGRLPGIGAKTEEKLAILHIKTIGELASADKLKIIDALGSQASGILSLANGIDEEKINGLNAILSISRESTLEKDAGSIDEIKGRLTELVHEVSEEAKSKSFIFKNVGIKIRYSDFSQATKSVMLKHYSDSESDIYDYALALIKSSIEKKRVRKIGVRISSLMEVKKQKRLF
jgi:nucleotidyltransferase/DNA polymerase involved in DNA repair